MQCFAECTFPLSCWRISLVLFTKERHFRWNYLFSPSKSTNIYSDGSSMFNQLVMDNTFHFPVVRNSGDSVRVLVLSMISHSVITTVLFFFSVDMENLFLTTTAMRCNGRHCELKDHWTCQNLVFVSLLRAHKWPNICWWKFSQWNSKMNYKRHTLK